MQPTHGPIAVWAGSCALFEILQHPELLMVSNM